jgi:hypothetical protein
MSEKGRLWTHRSAQAVRNDVFLGSSRAKSISVTLI